jgi:hypothetical protein
VAGRSRYLPIAEWALHTMPLRDVCISLGLRFPQRNGEEALVMREYELFKTQTGLAVNDYLVLQNANSVSVMSES